MIKLRSLHHFMELDLISFDLMGTAAYEKTLGGTAKKKKNEKLGLLCTGVDSGLIYFRPEVIWQQRHS